MDNVDVVSTHPFAADAVADLLERLDQPDRLWPLFLDQATRRLPCDACAVLRLDGDRLIPMATRGLSPDTLGRRFRLDDHPRLRAILESAEALTRFPADCPLPDPYDGLIPDGRDRLHVHDCVGAPLRRVGGGPAWGVMTFDALHPGQLDGFAPTMIALARLATALAEAAQRRAAPTAPIRGGEERFDERPDPALELVGDSPVMAALLRDIDAVADSDLVVLVLGETGVGKELVARRLHARSRRAQGPLVHVNCAALPDTLVESELFGHVRGAFSGAVADRRGKFELADGGTLFLDEVGELPLAVQAKMLRALQNGEIQRVGSDRHLTVNVRVIAATNRDLTREVAEGRFRADVYHRLSVYPLRVPPLRQRGHEALRLAGLFLERNRARLGLRNIRLSADAERRLLSYPWPGNVRELEHAIGRGAIRARVARAADGGVLTLTAADLGLTDAEETAPPPTTTPSPAASPPDDLPLRDAVEDLQRRMIRDHLARHDGNWAKAARSLGLDRSNLFRLAGRLGLRTE